jgi:hypothetical protein
MAESVAIWEETFVTCYPKMVSEEQEKLRNTSVMTDLSYQRFEIVTSWMQRWVDCGLLNNAAWNRDYLALNDRMLAFGELERTEGGGDKWIKMN